MTSLTGYENLEIGLIDNSDVKDIHNNSVSKTIPIANPKPYIYLSETERMISNSGG